MYGQLSFGFSYDLYAATLNTVDKARGCVQDPSCSPFSVTNAAGAPVTIPHDIADAGSYPWTGFQVVINDYGISGEISGLIPDLAASTANLNQLVAIAINQYNQQSIGLNAQDRQALFEKIFNNPSLSAAVDQNAALINQFFDVTFRDASINQ
jgi:hypothetical protein